MALTKKEKAYIEELLTETALRPTPDVEPDIPIPPYSQEKLNVGWTFVGVQSDWPRIVEACSSSHNHSTYRIDKVTTQQPIPLYSTEELALRALRRAVEKDCMRRLRKIDQMIEAHKQKQIKEGQQ